MANLEGKLKITAFNGSPKGEKSNTNFLVENFLYGAKEAGAEIENIFIADKKISNCRGCLRCWTKFDGECPQKNDDLKELLDKFINSEVVILAAPVYVGGVPGIFKNFMDHLTPLVDPRFVKDGNENYKSETPDWMHKVFDVVLPFFDQHYQRGVKGEYVHKNRYSKRPKVIAISNCGLTDKRNMDPIKKHFEDAVKNFNTEIVAEIYKGQGELFRDMSFQNRLIRRYYQGPLRKAGREFVEYGLISAETKERIEKPLLPEEIYMAITNRLFDKILSKRGLIKKPKINYLALAKDIGRDFLKYISKVKE
ncbi:MAG: flavodoxin family protein [archaeon]